MPHAEFASYMEFLVVIAFFGFLVYLRYYGTVNPADEKEGSSAKTAFFDKRFAINTAMVVMTSALLVYVVKNAESIHLPYLVAVFSAISIGFVEPYKGWLLAIMQCIFLCVGYFLFTARPDDQARQELENFSLYGSMILTFAASFLGGFLKRALNMK